MKEVRLGLGIDHGFGNIKTKHAVFKAAVKWYEQEPEVLKHVVGYRCRATFYK